MTADRNDGRRALRIYMSKSGLTMPQIAAELDCAPHSLRQFVSDATYGTSDGAVMAEKILAWTAANPIRQPDLPGKLYATRATREMDALLEHIREGGWGTLYGPSGSQKSFLLEYRGIEAASEAEPSVVYIRTSPSGMTPNVLLRRIGAAIGAPYAQATDALRQSIIFAMRRRRKSVAVVLDEADALYKWVETLETLREIGDLVRARPGRAGIGILVAGNERVMQIFENRRGVYFEKWRGRIEQEGLRVIGPSMEEAAQILRSELGDLKDATVAILTEGTTATDPESKRQYVNAHRLFNAVRGFLEKRRAKGNGKVN